MTDVTPDKILMKAIPMSFHKIYFGAKITKKKKSFKYYLKIIPFILICESIFPLKNETSHSIVFLELYFQ